MMTIDLTQEAGEMARLLEDTRQDDLVVRLDDGSEFLLVALDELDQEIFRIRNNPRLIALREARAAQKETISLDEVKRRLDS